MKKLLTFFLTALLAFGVGWAETTSDTYNFNSKSWGTTEDVSWNGSRDAYAYVTANAPWGVQVTTATSPVTVTSPTSYNNISKVELYYGSTSKAVGTISVSVAGTQIAYSGDTRSAIPVIPVHSVAGFQYRRQN